jgi:hypothetical protein
MGSQYNTNDFLKDVVNMSKLLATNARLINPLPENVDLSEAEDKEVQDQVLIDCLRASTSTRPISQYYNIPIFRFAR